MSAMHVGCLFVPGVVVPSGNTDWPAPSPPVPSALSPRWVVFWLMALFFMIPVTAIQVGDGECTGSTGAWYNQVPRHGRPCRACAA